MTLPPSFVSHAICRKVLTLPHRLLTLGGGARTSWYQLVPVGTNSFELVPAGASSYQRTPAGTSLHQLVPIGTSWYQFVPACTSGYQVLQAGTTWCHVTQYQRVPVGNYQLVQFVTSWYQLIQAGTSWVPAWYQVRAVGRAGIGCVGEGGHVGELVLRVSSKPPISIREHK